MKKIDFEKVMEGFTGELKISAKCKGSDIEQKIEYKNGNKICLLYIVTTILNTLYKEKALGKDLLEILICMLSELIKED